MKLCAVIDTNVLVSALLKWDSVPGAVLEQSLVGSLIPVLSGPILSEYSEVLHRKKFPFQEEDIRILIHRFYRRGIFLEPLAPPGRSARPEGCGILCGDDGSASKWGCLPCDRKHQALSAETLYRYSPRNADPSGTVEADRQRGKQGMRFLLWEAVMKASKRIPHGNGLGRYPLLCATGRV